MTKRVSWVAWNSEIATLLLFGCLQTTNMFYRIAAWLLFVSLLVWDHQAPCCRKHRMNHVTEVLWKRLMRPMKGLSKMPGTIKLTALTKSKKKFPLSVGLLMAYLQAESLSNSGRFFVTWMHGVEIPLVWTNMKLYPYDKYMTFNYNCIFNYSALFPISVSLLPWGVEFWKQNLVVKLMKHRHRCVWYSSTSAEPVHLLNLEVKLIESFFPLRFLYVSLRFNVLSLDVCLENYPRMCACMCCTNVLMPKSMWVWTRRFLDLWYLLCKVM